MYRKLGLGLAFFAMNSCSDASDGDTADSVAESGTSTSTSTSTASSENTASVDATTSGGSTGSTNPSGSAAGTEGTSGAEASGSTSDEAGSEASGEVSSAYEGTDTASDVVDACPVSAWFCEDFEALPGGPFEGNERWEVVVNAADRDNRTLAIEAGMTHGGEAALHATTAAGMTNNWQNFILHRFESPPEAFYGRVYVYVTHFAVKTTNLHWWMLEHRSYGEFNGIENTTNGHIVRILNGYYPADNVETTSQTFNYDIPGDGETGTTGPTYDRYEGRWTCFEWFHDVAADHLVLWQDGIELARAEGGIGDRHLPPAHAITLGAASNNGEYTRGFDVWFDDLALAPERVGCESTP